ncbi:hypothetical protein NIE88_01100 [Sporolactobacillus shoreicorticis]|uniref:Lipoprotein n=1 Tax=Sporolactobacillus shoreicorticis TaxID=1923877 RepID=A0ABW5S3X6_9BACL|nr:hypothetical protein [Sporolactobacillus shoreicorticis]MCO7124379.1 hypothetical protein [Sporolactobacillus shoreicorticis]
MKRLIILFATFFLIILSGCSARATSTSAVNVSKEHQNTDSTNHSSKNKSSDHAEDHSDIDMGQNSVNDQESDHSDSAGASSTSDTTDQSSSTNTSKNSQPAQADSSSSSTNTGNVTLSTSASAQLYLKQQLKMDHNNDLLFDDMGGLLNKDKKGSYYMIKLISKSLRKNGGSGTVGLYKVYKNGIYELAQ